MSVVKAALALAKLTPDDIVLDIGCGDGRVPIIAAKYFKSKGICVEINESLCALAEANIRLNGVEGLVEVACQDLFMYSYSKATVLYAYLYGSILSFLSNKIEAEMRRGSRIITIDFPIAGWVPIAVKKVIDEGGLVRSIYLYVIGASNPGSWVLTY